MKKRLKHVFVDLSSKRISRASMKVVRPNCSVFLLACFIINSSFSVAAEFIDLYSFKLAIDSEAKQQPLVASQKALGTVFVRATGDVDALKKYPVLAKNIDSADQLLASYSYYQDSMPLACLLYTSPSPRDKRQSRMPSSA